MIPSPGSSWKVKARAHLCASTANPFEEGQALVSRLITTQEGLQRDDYAEDQWDDEKRDASLFYWKTTYHAPKPKSEEPFKEENAAEAIQQLLEENDPANTNTLFILAALLERKRLWVEKAVQTDDEGRKIRIYEHKDGGETFFIIDPQIALEDLVELQQEVALKLGWIQPPSEEEEHGEEEAAEETPEGESPEENAEEEETGDVEDQEDGEDEDDFDEEEFDDEDEDEFDDEDDEDDDEDEED